jgi:spore germination protein KA
MPSGPREKVTAKVHPGLHKNLEEIKGTIGHNPDVIFREVHLGIKNRVKVGLVYIEQLVSKPLLYRNALESMLVQARQGPRSDFLSGPSPLEYLKNHALSIGDIQETDLMDAVIGHILAGDTAMFVDGQDKALILSVRGWENRPVEEPDGEIVIRGPRVGFTETLRTNMALLRRRIRTPALAFESFRLGRATHTEVLLAYIQGLAPENLVKEVRRRLDAVDVDGVLESNYIEEFIEDNPFSPFPQIEHTERPDKVSAALLEGRVAILTDGTPFALLVPTLFVQFLQASDDYYERFFIATFARLVRILAMAAALLLPGLYVAITTFHQEMLPSQLVFSIAAQREGVPFPAVVEVFILEFTFEVLREAGLRLPGRLGQALSIVGAIVLGQAAVQAGIVSPALVIVVALTGLATFAVPSFAMTVALRLLRFLLIAAGASMGLFGIMVTLMVVMTHLAALKSFGTPYLAPISPFSLGDMKDVAVRVPLWAMTRRPQSLGSANRTRQALRQAPGRAPLTTLWNWMGWGKKG